ncbi:hypothetical protein AVEN_91957-1 [Araneus ventricosus]|uniref:Uncharacterized protein n=1 Tax=Araneus ventricosus TaxID=182803 RepID=A0A4Y2VDK6_ARAVE|nr:hypothetical protein AVEN_91957-1 [Araneus ventricosus]
MWRILYSPKDDGPILCDQFVNLWNVLSKGKYMSAFWTRRQSFDQVLTGTGTGNRQNRQRSKANPVEAERMQALRECGDCHSEVGEA